MRSPSKFRSPVAGALRSVFVTTMFVMGLSAVAQQVQVRPGDELNREPARQGWHFYLEPKKEEPQPEPEPAPQPEKKAEPEKKDKGPVVIISGKPELTEEQKCQKMDTWSAKCGFIEPGDSFEFQAKQRDILLQQMSLRPDDPDAVEAAQRYMKWVVRKSVAASQMWYFNMIQKPDLDPTVKNPISEVGLALASRVEQASQQEYFRVIREEGGILFYFSKYDCSYCHDQSPYTQRVAKTMGLRVINIPLDGKCMPGFVGDDCGSNIKPELTRPLNVATVPTLFLYVPENTWIRLGTGVVSDATILANTVNFFSAYRAAMITGLDNGKGSRPSVLFDPEMRGKGQGTASANDAPTPAGAPNQGKILELLGYTPGSNTKK